MAKNEVFNVSTSLTDSSTGNLTAFSSSDFTQLVTQVVGPNGTYVLQVSPDGTNWYDETTLSVGSSSSQVVASSDIAFPQARIRFALSGTGGVAAIRVLGRL